MKFKQIELENSLIKCLRFKDLKEKDFNKFLKSEVFL